MFLLNHEKAYSAEHENCVKASDRYSYSFGRGLLGRACLVFLGVSMLAGGLSGCDNADTPGTAVQESSAKGQEGSGSSQTASGQANGTESADGSLFGHDASDELVFKDVEDPSGYFSFDEDFRNITFAGEDLAVTDFDVENEIESMRVDHVSYVEVTDRESRFQDKLNIDLKGTDGDRVIYEETGYNFTLGSGILPDLETALEGRKPGEQVSCDVSYEADYADRDLAGKTIHFEVTIHSIKEPVLPEFDDDFVKTYTSYDSMEDFQVGIQTELEKRKFSEAIETWMHDHAVLNDCPEEVYDRYEKELVDWYELVASYNDVSLEDLLLSFGYASKEAFLADESIQNTINQNICLDMSYFYIAAEMDMRSTYGAFEAYTEQFAADAGYQDGKELMLVFTEEEMLRYYAKSLVNDFLRDEITIE